MAANSLWLSVYAGVNIYVGAKVDGDCYGNFQSCNKKQAVQQRFNDSLWRDVKGGTANELCCLAFFIPACTGKTVVNLLGVCACSLTFQTNA